MRGHYVLADCSIPFLLEFIRNPTRVGTFAPSSRFLEQRIVQLAELQKSSFVVELGPGTGGTTRALLNELPEDSRLLAIELSPDFARLLERIRDPRLIVHCGSATEIAEIIADYGFPQPEVIVSGIPFSTLTEQTGLNILQSAAEALASEGRFLAYQVRRNIERLAHGFFGSPIVQMELFNVPPVRVYRWDKPSQALASSRPVGQARVQRDASVTGLSTASSVLDCVKNSAMTSSSGRS